MSEKGRYVRAPEFTVSEREGMKLLYATGAFGGLTPNDARIFFFTDRLQLEPGDIPGSQKLKTVNQEIQAEIHMSPATFKSVANWMMMNIQNYEKRFGEIKMGTPDDKKDSESRGTAYV